MGRILGLLLTRDGIAMLERANSVPGGGGSADMELTMLKPGGGLDRSGPGAMTGTAESDGMDSAVRGGLGKLRQLGGAVGGGGGIRLDGGGATGGGGVPEISKFCPGGGKAGGGGMMCPL